MATNKRVFTLRLTDEVFNKVGTLATEEHRSVTNYIEYVLLKHLGESTDIVKSNRKLILAVIANIGVFLVCLLTAALLPDSVLAIACVFCLAVAGVACLLYQIVKRI